MQDAAEESEEGQFLQHLWNWNKDIHSHLKCRQPLLFGKKPWVVSYTPDSERERLSINAKNWETKGSNYAIGDSRHLKRLDIFLKKASNDNNNPDDSSWLGELCLALSRNRSVQWLLLDMNFDNNPSSPDIFRILASFFEHNHKLRKVEIRKCGRMSEPRVFASFLSAMSKIKNNQLECIYMDQVNFTDEQSASLIHLLEEKQHNLRDIIFVDSGIGRSGCTAIAQLLKNPAVECENLALVEHHLIGDCVNILSSALIGISRLSQLNLRGNYGLLLRSEWYDDFSAVLTNHQCRIKKLWLHMTGVQDAGLSLLGDALARNTSIKYLEIHFNAGNTSVGRCAFLRCLQSCAIEILDLGDLLEREFRDVVPALSTNSSVEKWIIDPPTRIERDWTDLSNVLCDKSSIHMTYCSNHTLCMLDANWSDANDDIKKDIVKSLKMNMNENKNEVARQKILRQHFPDGGDNTANNIQVFEPLLEDVLHEALGWIGRDSVELTLMYSVIHRFPTLMEIRKNELLTEENEMAKKGKR